MLIKLAVRGTSRNFAKPLSASTTSAACKQATGRSIYYHPFFVKKYVKLTGYLVRNLAKIVLMKQHKKTSLEFPSLNST